MKEKIIKLLAKKLKEDKELEKEFDPSEVILID